MELPSDAVIFLLPCLDIYPKALKALYQMVICTFRVTAALFTIVNICKQPKCLRMDEQFEKMVHRHKSIFTLIKRRKPFYL